MLARTVFNRTDISMAFYLCAYKLIAIQIVKETDSWMVFVVNVSLMRIKQYLPINSTNGSFFFFSKTESEQQSFNCIFRSHISLFIYRMMDVEVE